MSLIDAHDISETLRHLDELDQLDNDFIDNYGYHTFETLEFCGYAYTRCIVCYECGADPEDDVVYGDEQEYLDTQKCKVCGSDDFQIEDLDGKKVFDRWVNDYVDKE